MTRRPAEVFPPLVFLAEELEARGWSVDDLADCLDWPRGFVAEIVAGDWMMTPEIAAALAGALGGTPQYWENLQTAFDTMGG